MRKLGRLTYGINAFPHQSCSVSQICAHYCLRKVAVLFQPRSFQDSSPNAADEICAMHAWYTLHTNETSVCSTHCDLPLVPAARPHSYYEGQIIPLICAQYDLSTGGSMKGRAALVSMMGGMKDVAASGVRSLYC